MLKNHNKTSDNKSTPIETKIYFSKTETWGSIIAGLIAFGGGIYMITIGSYGLGITICFAGLFVSYKGYKNNKDIRPQIIIDWAGIRSILTPFRAWHEIRNERVVTERSDRHATTYLIYETKTGTEKISISDLDIDKSSLENLLKIYRDISDTKTKR